MLRQPEGGIGKSVDRFLEDEAVGGVGMGAAALASSEVIGAATRWRRAAPTYDKRPRACCSRLDVACCRPRW